MKEGTSFGAALTGWMLAEGLTLDQIGKEYTIETTEVAAPDFCNIGPYEEAFMDLVGEQ